MYVPYCLFLLLFFDLRAPHATACTRSPLPSQLADIHPAIIAAITGDFTRLALLTKIPTTQGEEALHEAVSHGHIDCARFLLYWGIRPRAHTYTTAQKHHDSLSHLDPCKLSLEQLRRISIHHLLVLVKKGTSSTTPEDLE